jgi:hypothetical protein
MQATFWPNKFTLKLLVSACKRSVSEPVLSNQSQSAGDKFLTSRGVCHFTGIEKGKAFCVINTAVFTKLTDKQSLTH